MKPKKIVVTRQQVSDIDMSEEAEREAGNRYEHDDADVEMFGGEDAAYFAAAGMDDIGDK